MGLFTRKTDPIREHERRLQARLAELQEQIARLNAQIAEQQAQPKWRSTASPQAPAPVESLFEAVNHQPVTQPPPGGRAEPALPGPADRARGIRDWLRRVWQHLRGAPPANPTLIRYLAAGNVQGLRPLRYEKRVARNRFFALLGLFILVIWGLLYFYNR